MSTKKKIGTVLGEELLRRAKIAAARERIPFSLLLEKALGAYLRGGKRDIAAETYGALKAEAAIVKRKADKGRRGWKLP